MELELISSSTGFYRQNVGRMTACNSINEMVHNEKDERVNSEVTYK